MISVTLKDERMERTMLLASLHIRDNGKENPAS